MSREDAREELGKVMTQLHSKVVDKDGLAKAFLHSIGSGKVNISAVTQAGLTLPDIVNNVDIVYESARTLERSDLTDPHSLHMRHSEIYMAIARAYKLI